MHVNQHQRSNLEKWNELALEIFEATTDHQCRLLFAQNNVQKSFGVRRLKPQTVSTPSQKLHMQSSHNANGWKRCVIERDHSNNDCRRRKPQRITTENRWTQQKVSDKWSVLFIKLLKRHLTYRQHIYLLQHSTSSPGSFVFKKGLETTLLWQLFRSD